MKLKLFILCALLQGAVISGAVNGLSMGLGNAVGPAVDKAFGGIASPVLRNSLAQGLAGAGIGAFGGGLGAAMGGGDFWEGAGQGAMMGLGTGLATGGYSGFLSARAQGVSPWTGRGPAPTLPAPTITSTNPNTRRVNADVLVTADQQILDWYNEYARIYDQKQLITMPPAGPGNGIGYSGVLPNQVKYQPGLCSRVRCEGRNHNGSAGFTEKE